MINEEASYIPFGKEWEKEMMKLPKKVIIQNFKACAKDREYLIIETMQQRQYLKKINALIKKLNIKITK